MLQKCYIFPKHYEKCRLSNPHNLISVKIYVRHKPFQQCTFSVRHNPFHQYAFYVRHKSSTSAHFTSDTILHPAIIFRQTQIFTQQSFFVRHKSPYYYFILIRKVILCKKTGKSVYSYQFDSLYFSLYYNFSISSFDNSVTSTITSMSIPFSFIRFAVSI